MNQQVHRFFQLTTALEGLSLRSRQAAALKVIGRELNVLSDGHTCSVRLVA